MGQQHCLCVYLICAHLNVSTLKWTGGKNSLRSMLKRHVFKRQIKTSNEKVCRDMETNNKY